MEEIPSFWTAKKSSKTNWHSSPKENEILPVIFLKCTPPGDSHARFYVFEPVEITHGIKSYMCQHSKPHLEEEHQNFSTEVENYLASQAGLPNIYHITLTELTSRGPRRPQDHPAELCRLNWVSTFRKGKERKIQVFDFRLDKQTTVDTHACVVSQQWYYLYIPTTKQQLLFIHTSTNCTQEMARYYVFERMEKCTNYHYAWICQHSTKESGQDAETLTAYMLKYLKEPMSFYANSYHIELTPIHKECSATCDDEDDEHTSTTTPRVYNNPDR